MKRNVEETAPIINLAQPTMRLQVLEELVNGGKLEGALGNELVDSHRQVNTETGFDHLGGTRGTQGCIEIIHVPLLVRVQHRGRAQPRELRQRIVLVRVLDNCLEGRDAAWGRL
jgi:hypothetical protein